MKCLLKPLSLCLLLLLEQSYVYAVLSLGEVNVMILTLYYSSAVSTVNATIHCGSVHAN